MVGQEKRRSTRHTCKVPVMCKKGTMFDNSQTVDIGEHGIGFFSQKFVPVDTNMILEISLSPKSDALMAVGRVKWIRKVGYMDRYRVGMEFSDISSTNKSRLGEYLKEEL